MPIRVAKSARWGHAPWAARFHSNASVAEFHLLASATTHFRNESAARLDRNASAAGFLRHIWDRGVSTLSRSLAIAPSLAIAAALLLASGCKKAAPAGAGAAPPVEVVTVTQEDVPVVSEWVAVTDGLVDATIRAQTQGFLTKQDYEAGDVVRKGQVLFEIDPRPLQAAVAQAQAALGQAKAEVARNEAQLVLAQVSLKRTETLTAQKVASQQDLDNAVATERSAEAAVGSSKAAVDVAQAALEKAQLDLEYAKVTSPIDGVAGIAQAQIGDLVGPAQTGLLTTVSQLDPIRVYFSLNEPDYLHYMRLFCDAEGIVDYNNSVEHRLVLADGTLFPYPGRFHAIDREVDPRTGTLRVEVYFPNPNNMLRPGQFGRIRTTETKKDALLVPQRSVYDMQGTSQVAVVGGDNKIEIRKVKPSSQVGTLVVIDEGLKPGEQVVYEGVQKAKQGAPVTPKPHTDEAAKAAPTSSGPSQAKVALLAHPAAKRARLAPNNPGPD